MLGSEVLGGCWGWLRVWVGKGSEVGKGSGVGEVKLWE